MEGAVQVREVKPGTIASALMCRIKGKCLEQMWRHTASQRLLAAVHAKSLLPAHEACQQPTSNSSAFTAQTAATMPSAPSYLPPSTTVS